MIDDLELDIEIFRNFASVTQLHKCQKALECGKIARKSQKLGHFCPNFG